MQQANVAVVIAGDRPIRFPCCANQASTELRILRCLEHDGIIPLLDILEPPSYDHFDQLAFATKLMQSNLLDWLQNCGSRVHAGEELRFFKQIMYDVFRGLRFIHAAGVVHHDIKPESILLDLKLNADSEVAEGRLCGFENARICDPRTGLAEPDGRGGIEGEEPRVRWYE